MNNIIKELWHGNIVPQSDSRNNSPEMKQLMEYMARHHDDLLKTMTDEQKVIFEKYDDCWSEYASLAESAIFEYEAEYGEKPLGEFVREIVGLDMTAAKEAFVEYLSDVNLDADQIYFVNQIIEYIVRNGVMKDLSVLQEPPFTDRGSIVEVFTDLSVWLGIKSIIDRINANAAA